jgi:fumarate reductase subunit C
MRTASGEGWGGADPRSVPNPEHTPYHPRWYRERIPLFWWLRNRRYVKFIVRELTAVLVLYAALLLLALVVAVDRGPSAYAAFQEWLARPWVLALHLVILAGLLFHTVTWLNLAPKALVLRIGRRRISPGVVLVAHYLAWIGVSALVVAAVVAGMGA